MDTSFSVKRCKIILSLFFTTILFGQNVSNKILESEKLIFGVNNANTPVYSISPTTHLNSPFYKSGSNNIPLTKSGTPLSYGIKINGDGTNEWNTSGSSIINNNVTNQQFDYSGFIPTTGNRGYGVIVSKGDVSTNGVTLEIENRYSLDETSHYVKVDVKITNKSQQPITNVRYFVGSSDDFLGTNEAPLKKRGHFMNGSWTTISSQEKRTRALNITNNSDNIYLYTTHPKSNTIVHTNSTDFGLVTNRNPASSGTQSGSNAGYALFARLDDLDTNGASTQFTWYYAAGTNTSEIITEISKVSGYINGISLDKVTFNIQSKEANSTGYYIVVPAGSTIPRKEQIKTPSSYTAITPTTSGSIPISGNQFSNISQEISNLTSDTEYELHYVTQNSLDEYSNITTILFKTLPAFPLTLTKTDITCYGANNGSVQAITAIPGTYTYIWENINNTTSQISNLSPGTYTVRVTNDNGHTVTKEITLTQPNQISQPVITDQTFCTTATVADLPQENGTYKWYNTQTGGNALANTAVLTNGIYYVSKVNGQCESIRTAVNVLVNTAPTAPVVANQTFCNAATIADLPQENGTYLWYSTQTGGTVLANTTVLTNNTYYVSKVNGQCESIRMAVNVLVNTAPTAPVVANQTFCNTATIADLPQENGTYKWYNTLTGGTALANTTVITNGTYYVSEVNGQCESIRTAVNVLVNTAPTAPVVANQTFCNAATIADLPQENGTYLWYNTQTGGTALATTTDLTNSTYYVSEVNGQCESVRTAVNVLINTVPTAPFVTDQSFCNAATVAELPQANGTYLWYNTPTGGAPLNLQDTLVTGTYYCSQILNGCESSTRTPVNIYTNLDTLVKLKWDDVIVFDNTSNLYNSWQWYRNGVAIPGATQQYYSSTEPLTGTFYVIATNINGSTIQTCPYTVAQAKKTGGINIAPNPVFSGQTFNLEANHTAENLKGSQIIITDLSGKLISKVNNVKQHNVLYAPSSTGVYLVLLQFNNGNRQIAKLIVR